MGMDRLCPGLDQLDPLLIIFHGSDEEIKDTCSLDGSPIVTKTAGGVGKCRRTFPFDSLIWCVSISPLYEIS